MNKRGRLVVVLLVAVVAGIFLYPTVAWYTLVPQEAKNLALSSDSRIADYVGAKGEADLDELWALVKKDENAPLPEAYSFLKDRVKAWYGDKGKDVPSQWTIVDVFRTQNSAGAMQALLEEPYQQEIAKVQETSRKAIHFGRDLAGGSKVSLQADFATLEATLGRSISAEDKAVYLRQTASTLRDRLHAFDLAEPVVSITGTDTLEASIPGYADTETFAEYLTGKEALSFRILDASLSNQVLTYYNNNPGALFDADGNIQQPEGLPAGKKVVGYYVDNIYGVPTLYSLYVVDEANALDGSYVGNAVTYAGVSSSDAGVRFNLDATGSDIFYKLTSANTNGYYVLEFGGKIIAPPQAISTGIRGSIAMPGFSAATANSVVRALSTEALPVSLEVTDVQAVGPDMGVTTVSVAALAALGGFVLVLVFMYAVFNLSGLAADVSLLVHTVIFLAVLSALNVTLTVAGIVALAIVLLVALDAHVILFRKIREERASGKNVQAAVRSGFSKASTLIVEIHVVLLVVAMVLSQIGGMALENFSIILAVGLVSSLFSVLFVTKLILDAAVADKKEAALYIGWRNN